MIRMPCDECMKRLSAALDTDTIRSADNSVLNVHCSHRGLGLTAQVSRGLIVDWGIYPAQTIEQMQARVGAAAIGHLLCAHAEAQIIGDDATKH